MAAYKLTYFNIRARAEVARLLFAVAGQKYEDIRVSWEDWPKIKLTMPLGQMPILTVNDKVIPQSRAIERYLAREFGLFGKNNLENTMCDVVIETIHSDVRPHVRTFFFEQEESKKAEISKKIDEEVFPRFIKFLEHMLKDNGGKYLVGDGLTVADLAVYDYLQEACIMWNKKALGYSDLVKKHNDMVGEVPQVKHWVETRPKTER